MAEATRNLCESASRVLFRCWIGGFALLLIWLAAMLLLEDSIVQLHAKMFGLSKHEIDVIMYGGLGLFKLGVILLFFLPWLGLRLELARTTAVDHG